MRIILFLLTTFSYSALSVEIDVNRFCKKAREIKDENINTFGHIDELFNKDPFFADSFNKKLNFDREELRKDLDEDYFTFINISKNIVKAGALANYSAMSSLAFSTGSKDFMNYGARIMDAASLASGNYNLDSVKFKIDLKRGYFEGFKSNCEKEVKDLSQYLNVVEENLGNKTKIEDVIKDNELLESEDMLSLAQ